MSKINDMTWTLKLWFFPPKGWMVWWRCPFHSRRMFLQIGNSLEHWRTFLWQYGLVGLCGQCGLGGLCGPLLQEQRKVHQFEGTNSTTRLSIPLSVPLLLLQKMRELVLPMPSISAGPVLQSRSSSSSARDLHTNIVILFALVLIITWLVLFFRYININISSVVEF